MAVRRAPHDWLAAVQTQVLHGDHAEARATLAQALVEHPESIALRRAQAGEFARIGRAAEAEALLRGLLALDVRDSASAFLLAELLAKQDRAAATAQVLVDCFSPSAAIDVEHAIRAIEQLDALERKTDAARIARAALARHPDDARLHAYAGMLEIQLGNFEHAREHYRYALDHDERAWTWHAALGLASAQRFVDPAHPDLARLRAGAERPGLSDKARAEIQFALGKACDDLGDCEAAAARFREGNAIMQRITAWSRKPWRRTVRARLATKPGRPPCEPTAGFTPVFIVGMPRTGTTLVAERLSRYPKTCNRGEPPWLAGLAQCVNLAGSPDRAALRDGAAEYVRRALRDDAGDAHWFLDKQPLNFRYVDLALALFPDARIIHCTRHARDTALSLWTQCFLEDVQGYSYAFDDIALVMRDEAKLMAHWQGAFPDSIRDVRYEDMVSDPETVTAGLAQWIGLPSSPAHTTPPATTSISSASLWQARQRVHTRSRGRWTRYAAYLPELARFLDA